MQIQRRVCVCVCMGTGVCLPARGPVSGRARLCWDSQLLHGAVPGRAVGFVRVYWQPGRARARARMREAGRWPNRVDLLGHSDPLLLWLGSSNRMYLRHLLNNVAEKMK